MIPSYHGVFNNVNPVGERADIALRGVSRNVLLTRFFPPLSFFTLRNLTSGWNSIAIRSLTDRPISRDFLKKNKKGGGGRGCGISIHFLEKLFANYYKFFLDHFVIQILYFSFSLQSLFQFSRFLEILKKKINVFSFALNFF